MLTILSLLESDVTAFGSKLYEHQLISSFPTQRKNINDNLGPNNTLEMEYKASTITICIVS